MLRSILITILCTTSFSLFSQDHSHEDIYHSRKGSILVETTYNLVAGFGGGTGLSVFIPDAGGESIRSLGLEGGYFITEDLALKVKLGILANSGSLRTIMGGIKYYAGKFPLEMTIGTLSVSGGGDSTFLMAPKVGYAIHLASNITLEPSIGAIIGDGTVYTPGLGFSMFL